MRITSGAHDWNVPQHLVGAAEEARKTVSVITEYQNMGMMLRYIKQMFLSCILF